MTGKGLLAACSEAERCTQIADPQDEDLERTSSFLDDPDGVRFVAGEGPVPMSVGPTEDGSFEPDQGAAWVLAEQGAQADREAEAEVAVAGYMDAKEAAGAAI